MLVANTKSFELKSPDGECLFDCQMPTVGQIMACIKTMPKDEEALRNEPAAAKQERIIRQLQILLITPPVEFYHLSAGLAFWRRNRKIRRFLLGLQYHQLLDLYSKMLLVCQGLDIDDFEALESALEAQKKTVMTGPSTANSPLKPSI